MPRNVMLVTGPSRSADIEQTLELGAHGPRRLHVVLVEDATRSGSGARCLGACVAALSRTMEKPRRSRLTEADHAAWASYASRTTPLPGRKPPLAAEMPAAADRPPPEPEPRAATTACRAPTSAARIPRRLPLEVGTHPGGVDSGTWQRFRTGRLRGGEGAGPARPDGAAGLPRAGRRSCGRRTRSGSAASRS